MAIEWILFDLDDTLIPSSLIYRAAYKEMKLDRDLDFTKAKGLVKSTLSADHSSSHSRFLYFKKYLEIKSKFSSKLLLSMNDRYESILNEKIQLYLKKSARREVLQKLANKYKLGIVTNEVCRMQMVKMKSIDPKGNIFRFIITSEEVGVEKPHKKIFDEALARTLCTPSKVCFVGDSLKNDYLPAKKMGMKSYLTLEFLSEIEIKKNRNHKVAKTEILTNVDEIIDKVL